MNKNTLVLGPDQRLSPACVPGVDRDVTEISEALLAYAIKNARTCAGLAANQLGFNRRVCVIKNGAKFITLIDPEITKRSKGMMVSREGCLSWPGRTFTEKRSIMIKVKSRGRPTLKLRGFPARIAQHEIDHLNGKEI